VRPYADLPTLVNCEARQTPSPSPAFPLTHGDPFFPFPIFSPPYPPLVPILNPALRSDVSSPIGSGQRAQPPNVFWCNGGQNLAWSWIEGLAKWVNIFTNLRNLQLNSCTWLAELVFNLTICNFKRVFSDCAG